MKALLRPGFKRNSLALALAAAGFFSTAALAQGVDVPLTVSVVQIDGPAIRGQLSDDRNVLLQGALIRLIGTNRETTTDSQGRFRFDNLAAGTYQLEVSYLGYAVKQVDVLVTAEQGAALTLRFANNQV